MDIVFSKPMRASVRVPGAAHPFVFFDNIIRAATREGFIVLYAKHGGSRTRCRSLVPAEMMVTFESQP